MSSIDIGVRAMSGQRRDEWIVVTEDAKTLPVIEILTGRGFITGKSGSGKSNTASVIAEELLANGYNILIVDTEGEYFGLKEEFEILHVGGDDFADVKVGPGNAEKIGDIAIKQNVPVILDVSGFDDTDESRRLITNVLDHIYQLEKEARKPFLVMVEEMQEYLPQQGGGDDLAGLLERLAKRGRKRGVGICGMSQRPSSVDKDFITQCDWMVWHRLTWETDVNVVRSIMGSDRAREIQDFQPGRGILMTEWDDTVETVEFRRKRTHDAGATPGLENYERPDLKTVSSELIQEVGGEPTGGNRDLPSSPTETKPLAEIPDEPPTEIPDDTPTDLEISEEQEQVASDDPKPETTSGNEDREKELLAAEVDELRSILNGVEGRDDAPTTTEPQGGLPTPPQPPRRPARRDGIGGNLVEFGQMMAYLARSSWYRLRLTYHWYFGR